jgi:hypothetical protein
MAADQTELLALCLALAWLGGAILFARGNRPKEPTQLRRVPRAAAAFVAGNALIAVILTTLAGQLDIIRFHLLLLGLLILGMVAFLWVLVVDVVAILLRAARTPQWLAGGTVMIILFPYAWLYLIGAALAGTGPSPQSPFFITPGLIAAAAGLVWWSELPRPESADPDIFA